MHMRHDIESCDQGGEDQGKREGQVKGFGVMDRVAVKLEQDLAPMDDGNGEEQVKSRSMNQYDHVMI